MQALLYSRKTAILFLLLCTSLIFLLTIKSSFDQPFLDKYRTSKTFYKTEIQNFEDLDFTELDDPRFDNRPERNEEKSLSDQIREITGCTDTIQKSSIRQNGEYWILENFAVSKNQFQCSETITYVTHGDYTFLDNLVPVVTRWNGPISMALHAPGTDFQKTVDSIRYLRQCGPEIVEQYVTFHIFFNSSHMPEKMFGNDYLESPIDCNGDPPYLDANGTKTYKELNNMTYPINLGRNLARNGAQTHFHLVADIELYPSKEVIPKFLNMIANNQSLLGDEQNRRIFPLGIFEVENDQEVPENKTRLQELFKAEKAIFFHKRVCPSCHKIPQFEEWISTSETPDLNIFCSGKRSGAFKNWEPIFIGTNQDPFYEERQSWEGMSDKMTQGYALCVLDYEFMVLDNVFLCHRPGIKTKGPAPERSKYMIRTKELINKQVLPEMKVLYGVRDGCEV